MKDRALWPPGTSESAPAGSGRRIDEAAFMATMLVLALGLVWFCRTHGPQAVQRWFQPAPFSSALDVLLLLGAALAAIILHESGHLFAAVLLRFHLLGGSLGPLQMQSLHGKRKLFWEPGQFFSGSISATPRSLKNWPLEMMIVAAAGPLATLGFAIAAAGLNITGAAAQFFQLAFVQVSALLFVLGLIPNGANASRHNDARLLLDLAAGNRGELELNLELNQLAIRGDRPQDYPIQLIKRVSKWRGRPESQVHFAQTMVRWALDSGETELADAWDLYAVGLAEWCSGRRRNSALAASACFDVIFRDDLEMARIKMQRVVCNDLFPACFEQRVRAAHQLALGRLHRVSQHILRAQYALPLGISAYELERSLIEKIHLKMLGMTVAAKAKAASV